MAFRAGLLPDLFDFPVRADQAGTADNSEEILSQKTLHAAGAVRFDDVKVGIAEQWEVQFMLGPKLGHHLRGVTAAAQDDGVELVEFRLGVAKLGRFVGSTRREGLREEIEHNVSAAEPGERNFRAVVGGQPKIRGPISLF